MVRGCSKLNFKLKVVVRLSEFTKNSFTASECLIKVKLFKVNIFIELLNESLKAD